jgi:hypothetical protein
VVPTARADEDHARVGAGLRELGVLGEEAVAGWMASAPVRRTTSSIASMARRSRPAD